MNKYVLKNSQIYVNLVREKKFPKKRKKLPSHSMTPLSLGSTITKIRPQAKIDNFAFQNSNIIIEGLI